MADQGQGHGPAGHAHSRKPYFVVFGVLFVLTVLEVAVANPALGISRRNVGIALILMALTKAGFVGYYYMHLKQEMRALQLTVVLPFLLPALYAFVLIAEAVWRLLP
ncbi:MAG: cytochrome C oxidase subunit IV family protein [Myxococcota bacterium]